jgi:hypothetical protein
MTAIIIIGTISNRNNEKLKVFGFVKKNGENIASKTTGIVIT